MELIEIECANCHNVLLIQEDYVKETMFCKLGCMSSFYEDGSLQYLHD